MLKNTRADKLVFKLEVEWSYYPKYDVVNGTLTLLVY
jgi:hypothetical protein